jgi:hypothetical protein
MKQEEIIEIIIQLGFDERLSNNWLVSEEQLMRFSKLVAAKEREACAKVCDVVHMLEVLANPAEKCAKAIRARGITEV